MGLSLVLLPLLAVAAYSGSGEAISPDACAAAAGCPQRVQRPGGAAFRAAARDIEGGPEERLQLLQVRGTAARASGSRARPDVLTPELARVEPISWVHVPKCGSSFLNTLIHLPGVCPGYPDDLVISQETYGPTFLDAFKSSHDMESDCPGLLHTNFGHPGIEKEPGWDKGQGHFMTMLRQPEQRIISAYKDLVLAVKVVKERPNFARRTGHGPDSIRKKDRSWGGWPAAELPTAREFAEYAAGCSTRMLTRGGWACSGAHGPPTPAEVDEAKRRLREGFAFVGLTDEWSLSMCLFSKMFKVGCHAYQFHNTRPARNHTSEGGEGDQPVWPLEGFVDRYDGELYAEATRIFRENLQRYDVSEATCESCFRQASVQAPTAAAAAGARAAAAYQDELHGSEP